VIRAGIFFGKTIAPALLGDHMDHHRFSEVPRVLNNLHELREIVPIYRPHILKSKVNKKIINIKNRFNRTL